MLQLRFPFPGIVFVPFDTRARNKQLREVMRRNKCGNYNLMQSNDLGQRDQGRNDENGDNKKDIEYNLKSKGNNAYLVVVCRLETPPRGNGKRESECNDSEERSRLERSCETFFSFSADSMNFPSTCSSQE